MRRRFVVRFLSLSAGTLTIEPIVVIRECREPIENDGLGYHARALQG
jgi:hypothetical protein